MSVYSQQLAELRRTKVRLEKALSSATQKTAELGIREGALKSAIRERGAWMVTVLKTASPSLPVPVACSVLEAETEISKLLSKLDISSSTPVKSAQPASSTSSCGGTNSPSTLTHFQHVRGLTTPDVLETVRGWTWQDYNNSASLFVR